MSTEEDVDLIINMLCDYIGNYNSLSNRDIDRFVEKTANLKFAHKLNSIFANHRALLYYPNPKLLTKIMKQYDAEKDWEKIKAFYASIARKYYILKQSVIYDIYINNAFEMKDYKLCVDAFLDILDYTTIILEERTYNQILYANDQLPKDKVFVEIFEVTYF